MSYHDMPPNLSICPSCEIPILLGTSHGSLQGCYVALKAFVKLCQDDIENHRMEDFQHPTREELMHSFNHLEDQLGKFVFYVEAARQYIKDARSGTLVG